jgi:hypothetical protein
VTVDGETETAWGETGYAGLLPRPREAKHANLPTWNSPRIVTTAKCLAHVAGCPSFVEVTAEGMHALESFTRQLAKRGERPLELNHCFMCDGCRVENQRASEIKSAARRGRVTEAIRYLKAVESSVLEDAYEIFSASRTAPERTRDAVIASMERLGLLKTVLGGGYVSDLVANLRDANRAGRSGSRKDGGR